MLVRHEPQTCVHRRALALLACVCALVLVLAGGASAAEKGVYSDLSWGTDETTKRRTAEALADLGSQWTVADISWRLTEPSKGTFDEASFAELDRALELAGAAGARVVLTVTETPQWASGSADPRYPPSNPADLADFYRRLVARYADRVDAWQVLNEPNHPHFWRPDPRTDPSSCLGYANLLKAAYPVIRTGDPSSTVLFAGLAFNDYAYLERCYELVPDLGNHFDAMTTHPYAMGGLAPETVKDTAPQDGRQDYQTFLAYREMRRTMLDHGDDKPIWFTEFGWSTATDGHELGNVTRATQADYLARAYKLLEQDPYVQVAIWYSLRNVGAGNDWLSQLGLMDYDFAAKPAYAAFRAYQPPVPPSLPKDPATPSDSGLPAAGGGEDGAPTTRVFAVSTSVTLQVRRLRPRGSSARVRLSGIVRAARGGRVTLLVERRGRRGAWTSVVNKGASLSVSARFDRVLRVPRGARLRARATYGGTAEAAASASRYVQFRTRR